MSNLNLHIFPLSSSKEEEGELSLPKTWTK